MFENPTCILTNPQKQNLDFDNVDSWKYDKFCYIKESLAIRHIHNFPLLSAISFSHVHFIH